MVGPLKLTLAAIVVAGVGGLLAGLTLAPDGPDPRIGEPVVLTPAPTSTPPSTPPGTPTGSPDDSAEDDDDDRIKEVERSPEPWQRTDGGTRHASPADDAGSDDDGGAADDRDDGDRDDGDRDDGDDDNDDDGGDDGGDDGDDG